MKRAGIALGVIVLVVIGFVFFKLPQPIIELRPETLFSIGPLNVTNTILTAWIMIALISLVTLLGTRSLKLIPSGFQNVFEAIIEAFGGIVDSVAGEKNGRRFFPVVLAFLLYILVCNWAALTPLFNQIGKTENLYSEIHHEADEHPEEVTSSVSDIQGYLLTKSGLTVVPFFKKVDKVKVEVPAGTTFAARARLMDEEIAKTTNLDAANPIPDGKTFGVIAPFLRGVNTDLNAPLSYALWSAIFVEMWGITTLGLGGYGGKFFNFKKLLKGDILNGFIDVFVGLLELISEASRLISFTFRLFGNIFAGEVLLFMMSFLVPFVLVDAFYGLELFVGLIQAFVFAMLTLVFGVGAVAAHGDHDDQHTAAHPSHVGEVEHTTAHA